MILMACNMYALRTYFYSLFQSYFILFYFILFYFREESTLTTGGKQEIFENDKVFVEGISTTTSKDSFKYYMERISGLPVKDITYGTKSSDGTVGESRNDPENISEDVPHRIVESIKLPS